MQLICLNFISRELDIHCDYAYLERKILYIQYVPHNVQKKAKKKLNHAIHALNGWLKCNILNIYLPNELLSFLNNINLIVSLWSVHKEIWC